MIKSKLLFGFGKIHLSGKILGQGLRDIAKAFVASYNFSKIMKNPYIKKC